MKPFNTGLKSAKKSIQDIAENNMSRAVGQEVLKKDPTAHMVAGVLKKPVGKISKKFTAQRKNRLNQRLKRPTEERVVNARFRKANNRPNRSINKMFPYSSSRQKTNTNPLPRNNTQNVETYKRELSNIYKETRRKMREEARKEQINRDREFELEQIRKFKKSRKLNPDTKTIFKSHGDGEFIDYENLGKNETYKSYNKIHNKKASEEIDELYKTASATPPAPPVPTDPYVVELGKNFLKGGLESLPSMIAPATLGYLIHRDLKTMQKLKKETNDKKSERKKKKGCPIPLGITASVSIRIFIKTSQAFSRFFITSFC